MNTTSEEATWLPVDGWPGYEISDDGRVWTAGEYHRRPMELSTKLGLGGYPTVTLQHRGRKRTVRVYKLVADAFIGPCPSGMMVRHRNGDPMDSRVQNLQYGSGSDNEADKIAHGRNYQMNKTHCPHGHPYTPSNTGWHGTARRCLTCHRERQRARYHQRKGGSQLV